MVRTTLLAATVVMSTVAVAPALGAPPKPMSHEFTFTDATPDPTATVVLTPLCDGMLFPNEPGIEFSAPAGGKLKVSLTATGDWGLEVRDPKGKVLGSSDGDTPDDQESVQVKLKSAGVYTIVPCNFGGLPEATGIIEYKP